VPGGALVSASEWRTPWSVRAGDPEGAPAGVSFGEGWILPHRRGL